MLILASLFDILQTAFTHHHEFFNIVYKKLTFFLIKNHEHQLLREVIVSNFLSVFTLFKNTVDPNVLLNPLIK